MMVVLQDVSLFFFEQETAFGKPFRKHEVVFW